ncbi:MAG TPA: hypothetical protein VG389_03245 [Myxococcota bacterium]|jgi:hypothetical protein|nr:hypothetical protein [Myxococcota bacterium]
MWGAIQYVTGGFALAAFLAAVAAWGLVQGAAQKRKLIEAAPDKERARLIAENIGILRVPTDGLSAAQKHDLLRRQLELQAARWRIIALVVSCVTVVLGGVALAGLFVSPGDGASRGSAAADPAGPGTAASDPTPPGTGGGGGEGGTAIVVRVTTVGSTAPATAATGTTGATGRPGTASGSASGSASGTSGATSAGTAETAGTVGTAGGDGGTTTIDVTIFCTPECPKGVTVTVATSGGPVPMRLPVDPSGSIRVPRELVPRILSLDWAGKRIDHPIRVGPAGAATIDPDRLRAVLGHLPATTTTKHPVVAPLGEVVAPAPH